uniref:Ig-like domain-containing protein n=1 Tax=Strigamia maritima TaxID=126957 RepID=T1IZ98_STRMM
MGISEDLPPSFTQKPQLRQEDEGNKLLFECSLLAHPLPEIQWYRGDEKLSENSRTVFSDHTDRTAEIYGGSRTR